MLALSYRLTGSAEDAEEAVQETFVRAVEQPPPRAKGPWRLWLVRVATNLSLDALRRRKRRAYAGPWLPSPLADREGGILLGPAPADGGRTVDPEAECELRESATLAFLVALEVLPPRQRAALVLREAFELSAREVGAVLQVSEGGARMLIHRARETLRSARPHGRRPLRSLEARSHAVLSRLLESMLRGDFERVAALLREDVQLWTDSGGHVRALAQPMVGGRRVATLLTRVGRRRLPGSKTELLTVNALPALWIEFASAQNRRAPRALLACDLDPRGLTCGLFAIVDPFKLSRVGTVDRCVPGGRGEG